MLFLLRASELTADSLNEARRLQSGETVFHPHHLLFTTVGRAIYSAITFIAPHVDPILVGQAHSALWTGLAVWGAHALLAHELSSPRAALLWTLALPASAGYMRFATQLEAYVPASGCLLLLGAVLTRQRTLGTLLAAIGLFALAVLFHQSAVLFAVPLLFLVRGTEVQERPRGWMVTYAVILVGSGALVLTAYLLASGAGSLIGALEFSVAYASRSTPEWATWANVTPHGAFQLLRSQLLNIVHLSDTYSPATSASVLAFTLLLLLLALVAGYGVRWNRLPPGRVLLPATWLGTHWAFVLWFLPRESDFFVVTVFPLLLLSALVADSVVQQKARRGIGLRVGALLLAGCMAWNLAHVALPMHRDRGASYHEAAALARAGLLRETFVLAHYDLVVRLSFYFGVRGTGIVQHALVRAYVPESSTPAPALGEAKRVLVPVRFVVPAYRVGSYSGRTSPEGWLDFLCWLTALDPGGPGREPSHAAVDLEKTAPGAAYLIVQREERVVGDLRALLRDLDQLVSPSAPMFLDAGSSTAKTSR